MEVLSKSFILYWSEAVRRNCSAVSGGYHAMHIGTAVCSMRTELRMRRLSTVLFFRSYSTYKSAPKLKVHVKYVAFTMLT